MSNLKLHKIEMVKAWINKLSAFDGYSSEMVKSFNGDELDNMSLKEINMLLTYIRVCYHVGFQECSKLNKESV